MDEWVWWMIAAGVLAVGEIFTLGFFLGPIAIAAVLAAIVALAGGGLAASWIVFIAASLGSLARAAADRATPPAHAAADPHRHGGAGRRRRPWCSSAWIADGGRVKIGGEIWTRARLRRGRARSSRAPASRS